MALNSIYQLILQQEYRQKQMINVFFFNHAAGTGHAGELNLQFEEQWLPLILALQTNAVTTLELDSINLGDLSDFDTLLNNDIGAYSTEVLPAANALNFTFKLDTRAVRPGSKRFSGIPETVTNEGIINDTTYLTKIEALRLAMSGNLIGAGDTFQPVVVKRVKTPVTGTVPLQYTYRLPKTDSELVFGGVTVALTSDQVSTQVSRKK